jgi:uncharacterized protein YecE (DUF72 family)
MPGTLMVGTSGFSYGSWRGAFYPRKLPSSSMISYYGTRLNTVEVNTTFYRTQPGEVIASWVEAVPSDFRFAVKAHRRITHNRRMPNLEAAMEMLAEEAAAFGDRLGPVLFQLPPTAPCEPARIERIMALAPKPWRVAFQFRHPSWHVEQIANLVEGFGAALVHGDGEAQPGPFGTGAFLYLRLRRDAYSPQRLAALSRKLLPHLQAGRDAYVYFKHERLGPLYAERFVNRLRTSFRVMATTAL